MEFHQSVSNVVARQCSAAEMSKWYDAGTPPEYLKPELAAQMASRMMAETIHTEPIPEPEIIS